MRNWFTEEFVTTSYTSCTIAREFKRRHRANLFGENASKFFTHVTEPVAISSAIAAPDAGEYSIPQHECPVATYSPFVPGTAPMTGMPSWVIGR